MVLSVQLNIWGYVGSYFELWQFGVFGYLNSLLASYVFNFPSLTRMKRIRLPLYRKFIRRRGIFRFLLFNFGAGTPGKRLLLGVPGTGIPWRRWSPSKFLLIVFIGATFSLLADFTYVLELILLLLLLSCVASSSILFA